MWTLIQIVFDIFATLGFFVIIMRMNRAPKDDPRLSRGLQLLQSKISVLEDLSDRTETQANQLSAILEQKCREVQAKVQIAEAHVHEIKVSMDRSLEVAKIFQDKIPHQEIIERQNTLKYVQAARLAHQGLSPEEISKQVDLPKGEIEFIAKVNRDQLMFNEDQLPEWARAGAMTPPSAAEAQEPYVQTQTMPAFVEASADESRRRTEMDLAERSRLVEKLSHLQSEMQNLDLQLARETTNRDMTTAFEAPKVEMGSLQRLGDEFRKACEDAEKENNRPGILPPLEHLTSIIPQMFAHATEAATPTAAAEVTPSVVVDPEAARAAAVAKVQAALARGRASEQSAKDELAAAKAAAQSQVAPVMPVQAAVTQVQAVVVTAAQKPAAPSPAVAAAPVIRKVEFPRIDSPVR